MTIAFRTSADTYSNGQISISVVTGDLIVGMGYGSESCSTLTFSGGGTWVHLTGFGSSGHFGRIGYILSTTGSGSTAFDEANETGDFAWSVAAYSHSGTISYINQESLLNLSSTTFSSGSGIAGSLGDLRVGGWLSEGGGEGGFSSWDHGYATSTEDTTHFDKTCYLIDGSAQTIDCSGINGVTINFRLAWQAVFHETGGSVGQKYKLPCYNPAVLP